MSNDFSHIEYVDKDKVSKDANTIRIESVDDISALAALGIPIIGNS